MTAPNRADVSRETSDALMRFVTLLEKWNTAINLIGKSTVADIWSRHIEDSLQLAYFLPGKAVLWADLGSGGGLPGLVVAIAARETSPDSRFVLVESDLRKATFLREASRQLALPVTVHSERIEGLAPISADILSARALAPLRILCGYADRHLKPDGFALFPKGELAAQEITEARSQWAFDVDSVPSLTQSSAHILKLKGLRHV